MEARAEVLPAWEHEDSSELRVAAPPATALEAVREATVAEMPLTLLIFTLRGIPTMMARRRVPFTLRRSMLEQLLRSPRFMRLEESPGSHLAFGYVGKPWTVRGGGRRLEGREQFVEFREPGYAKVVADFRADPVDGGCLLRTRTRIHLTEASRRAFGRYWLVVRYGSLAQRKSWMRAARKRAESA